MAPLPFVSTKRRLRSSWPMDLPKYHSERVQYQKKTKIDNGDQTDRSNPGKRGSRSGGTSFVSICSRPKYANITLMIR